MPPNYATTAGNRQAFRFSPTPRRSGLMTAMDAEEAEEKERDRAAGLVGENLLAAKNILGRNKFSATVGSFLAPLSLSVSSPAAVGLIPIWYREARKRRRRVGVHSVCVLRDLIITLLLLFPQNKYYCIWVLKHRMVVGLSDAHVAMICKCGLTGQLMSIINNTECAARDPRNGGKSG